MYPVFVLLIGEQDKTLYTQNGILHMLERNRRVKEMPQRLQDSPEK